MEAIFSPNGRSPIGVNSISSIDPPVTSSVVGYSATDNNDTTTATTQLSGGAIAGIAVGSFAGIAIVVGGLLFLFLRRRRAQRKAQAVEIEKNGPRELGGNGIQGTVAQQEHYIPLKYNIGVHEVPGTQAQVHEMPSYPAELEGAVVYGREHKLTSG